MQKKILFINACARPNSRTLELAEHLLGLREGDIKKVNLFEENISPLNFSGLENRTKSTGEGDFSHRDFKYAKDFAEADSIVVASPYWDLSFPSVLKVYFEAVTVSGLTFFYSEKGIPKGLCKAKELYYITTSGGFIGKNNFGFDYVKALAENFYGIEKVSCYSAEGLDIFGADVDEIMKKAKNRISVGALR